MDKAQCVALFLVVLVLFARPSLGTLRERTSEITAWHCLSPRSLRVSVVGRTTWHRRPQRAGLSTWWQNSQPHDPPAALRQGEAENRLLSSALSLDRASWWAGLGRGAPTSSHAL